MEAQGNFLKGNILPRICTLSFYFMRTENNTVQVYGTLFQCYSGKTALATIVPQFQRSARNNFTKITRNEPDLLLHPVSVTKYQHHLQARARFPRAARENYARTHNSLRAAWGRSIEGGFEPWIRICTLIRASVEDTFPVSVIGACDHVFLASLKMIATRSHGGVRSARRTGDWRCWSTAPLIRYRWTSYSLSCPQFRSPTSAYRQPIRWTASSADVGVSDWPVSGFDISQSPGFRDLAASKIGTPPRPRNIPWKRRKYCGTYCNEDM